MRKLFVIICLLASLTSVAQVSIDTLYYDKDGMGIEAIPFATYYRIIARSGDGNFRKQFKDFYVTGELYAEGNYVTIDKYDDSKSVFDGEYTRYVKNGKKLRHAFYKNGKLDGTFTMYSEDSNVYTETEFDEGEPRYDYCILASTDGLSSKVRLSDNQPMFERASVGERTTDYIDGEPWQVYNKNGMVIYANYSAVKDYGKYYRIQIGISNNSMYPIDINPDEISVTLLDTKGINQEMKIFTADEYMKKVDRGQKWKKWNNAADENAAAYQAGKSSSTTNTTSNSTTTASAYGSSTTKTTTTYGNASGSSSTQKQTKSTTNSYDGKAAYEARLIAEERKAAFNESMDEERADKWENYIKRSVIYPGEATLGYINIEKKKGISMTLDVKINGIGYEFDWNLNK